MNELNTKTADMMIQIGDVVHVTELRTLALVTEVLPGWVPGEVVFEVDPLGPDGQVIDPFDMPVTVQEADVVEVVQRPREVEVHPDDVRETLRAHRLRWCYGRLPIRVPLRAIANLEQLAQPPGHDSGLDRLKRFEEMEDGMVKRWVRLAPGFVWAADTP